MMSLKNTLLPAIIIITIVVIEYIVLNTNVFDPLFVVEEQQQHQTTVHTHKDKRWLEYYFENMHDTGLCGNALEKYAEKHKKWRMTPPAERNVSVVIWSCWKDCGGIGDRFRGLFGSLLYSLLTDSMFLVDNTFPVELSETLSPSLIDWRYNESLITGMKYESIRHIDNQRLYNLSNVFSIDEMTTTLLRLKTNEPAEARGIVANGRISSLFILSTEPETQTKMRELGFGYETKESDPFINLEIALSKWIHCAFTSLFKFMPRKLFIQSVAGPFALIKNSNFSIGLHIRLGDHSFNTTRKEEIQRAFTNGLPAIKEQLQKHNRVPAETTICDVVITNGSGFSKLAAHLGGRFVVPMNPNAQRDAEK